MNVFIHIQKGFRELLNVQEGIRRAGWAVQGRGRQFLIDGRDEDGPRRTSGRRPNLENLKDVPDQAKKI